MKLNQPDLQAALLCGEAVIFDEIDSTNEYLLREYKHLAAGSVCAAEHQTAGRGRRGRSWYSGKNQNLCFSLLWRYSADEVQQVSALSLMVALVLAESFTELGISDIQIKWPNDVYYQGKKLGGILIESRFENNDYYLVIGIGLNLSMDQVDLNVVNQPYADLSAYHLERNQLLQKIVPQLQKNLKIYPLVGFENYVERWQSYDLFYGKPVKLLAGDTEIHGISKGINDKGELLLEQAGKINAYAIGEMSLRAQ